MAFVLWLCLGLFGAHRFYLGQRGVGIAMVLTLGGLGVWALIDGFFLPSRLRKVNEDIFVSVYRRHGLPVDRARR
ncbi:TM2 domain-containing protein [Nesterenkonia sp. E16_7]|uniref:TM2 domain-containing protein n=1 Tax=unclassified Nesterenkonia TaxID=2629769 RepID=UPI0031F67A40|nr:TM2 domain-containing protein [Nesterenkonia sp. E16_10]MBO0599390.1 TM2 domain-containing protein [Nesterenkonia sp. E16_7]